jgi:hypothetical protein
LFDSFLTAALLGNLLDALPLANIKPKRILLQTGAKNYNVCSSTRKPLMTQSLTIYRYTKARREHPLSNP